MTLAILANCIALAALVICTGLLGETLYEWITIASGWTATTETAHSVGADSGKATLSVSAKSERAFVDIETFLSGIATHANWAGTFKVAQRVGAYCILATMPRGSKSSIAFINIFTISKRVSCKARWTMAMMTTEYVGAYCSLSAEARRSVTCVTLVDIDTSGADVIRIEGITLVTNAGRLVSFDMARGKFGTLHGITGC